MYEREWAISQGASRRTETDAELDAEFAERRAELARMEAENPHVIPEYDGPDWYEGGQPSTFVQEQLDWDEMHG